MSKKANKDVRKQFRLKEFRNQMEKINKPKSTKTPIKVDITEIITFENYYKQFVKTFFGESDLTKEQEVVIKTTFYSGAACLNTIIETVSRMSMRPQTKEKILAKILMELEFYIMQPTEGTPKQ